MLADDLSYIEEVERQKDSVKTLRLIDVRRQSEDESSDTENVLHNAGSLGLSRESIYNDSAQNRLESEDSKIRSPSLGCELRIRFGRVDIHLRASHALRTHAIRSLVWAIAVAAHR
jgi:hypothetical protein